MSEQTLRLVERLRRRLQATIRRVTLAELLRGLALMLGVVSAVLLVAAALEAGFWFAPGPRFFFFWTFILGGLGLAGYFLLAPLLRLVGWLRGPSEAGMAQRIGRHYPEVSDRLTNLLQLADGRRSVAPEPLLDGAISELGQRVETVPFEQVEDFAHAKRIGRWAAFPVLGLLFFLIAAPSVFLDATGRLFAPNTLFQPPAPFRLDVQPGDVELVKGEPLDLTVQAFGQALPQRVRFAWQQDGETHTDIFDALPDSTGAFTHRLINVRQSLRYRVLAGAVESPWYTATVVNRPVVRTLQVQLNFPAYTRMPPRRLPPNVGDVVALPGTQVALTVGLGGADVAAAFLHFDDSARVDLDAQDREATGTFRLRREGQYQVMLESPAGVSNADPIAYTLKLQRDEHPSVALIDPRPSEELNDAQSVGLRMRIIDDFGFSGLRLLYRLAETRFGEPMPDFKALPLPLPSTTLLDQEVAHPWLLPESTGMEFLPGDVVEYFVEVRDNDRVAGFKAGRSPVYVLRFPSLAEQYEALDAEQESAQDELENLLEQSQQVRDEFEELRDELRRKQEADWEDERQLERLSQQQKSVEQRAEDLAEQMENMLDTMAENDLVNEQTMEMYQDLQKVMEEMNAPELMEALQKLQEAMQNMDMNQMQQSIGQFEFNEEQYRQRLERALELFKRLRTEQKLDEAIKRTETLAEQQENLAKETEALKEEEDPANAQDEQEQPTPEEAGTEEEGGQNPEETANPEAEDPSETGEEQSGDAEQEDAQPPQDGQSPQDGQQPQDGPRNEQLAKEQQASKEEMEALEKLLEQLQEQMDELQSAPKQEMNQMMDQVQEQDLSQQMQQNSQQLMQNQLSKAQQGQQNMQQQLEQMAQQMQQMQQQMSQEQLDINIAALRRTLDDVLTLSKEQEALRENTRQLTADNPMARQFSQQQVELSEGVRVVSDTLQKLSKDIPQMSREVQRRSGAALQDMDQTVAEMTDRRISRASGHQKSAMANLNELALLLSELMDQLQQQQDGSGGSGNMSMSQMMQQLQQMAGQQQQLNNQIQQMLNDMQGNRLSQSQQERLAQMAAQQAAIRQQLEQMMQQGGSQMEQLLGDLDQVGKQMEQAVQELQRRQLDPKVVERQQQILTRLLDAQRSLRERGRERKREGRQGQDVTRTSPGELSPSQQAEKLRRDLIRALESGYAPDYEELIKRYFDALQERNTEQR